MDVYVTLLLKNAFQEYLLLKEETQRITQTLNPVFLALTMDYIIENVQEWGELEVLNMAYSLGKKGEELLKRVNFPEGPYLSLFEPYVNFKRL